MKGHAGSGPQFLRKAGPHLHIYEPRRHSVYVKLLDFRVTRFIRPPQSSPTSILHATGCSNHPVSAFLFPLPPLHPDSSPSSLLILNTLLQLNCISLFYFKSIFIILFHFPFPISHFLFPSQRNFWTLDGSFFFVYQPSPFLLPLLSL